MSEIEKTKKQVDTEKAELLDRYAGPHCGEIFLTARNMFDRFLSLQRMSMKFMDDHDGGYYFYVDTDPVSSHMGINVNNEQKLDKRLLQRTRERFKLSDEVIELFQELPGAVRPLILAHEIAHVIQIDPLFLEYYGDDFNYKNINPRVNYAGYLESDLEANADFIAASIVANTDYGVSLGLGLQPFETLQWRDWVAERPMLETIAYFGETHATSHEMVQRQ